MNNIGDEAPRVDRERRLALMLRVRRSSQPWSSSKELLRRAGLRPTKQRMALWTLFARGDRHITAEKLHHEAVQADVLDGSRSFFDTKLTGHHHFFVQGEEFLLDIPASEAALDRLPEPPAGCEITRVDVVVRLRRVQA